MRELGRNIWCFDDLISSSICNDLIARFNDHDKRIPSHVYNKSNTQARSGEVILLSDLTGKHEDSYNIVRQRIGESCLEASVINEGLRSIFLENVLWTEPRVEKVSAGGGFIWHMDSRQRGRDRRILTAVLYLNELKGGEIEFLYDGIIVDPAPGRLLLFPPYWTHVHRGRSPDRGFEKFSIGSFAYVSDDSDDGRYYPDAGEAL